MSQRRREKWGDSAHETVLRHMTAGNGQDWVTAGEKEREREREIERERERERERGREKEREREVERKEEHKALSYMHAETVTGCPNKSHNKTQLYK
jgi:hypothetical protein